MPLIAVAAFVLAACSSSPKGTPSPSPRPPGAQLNVLAASTDFAVGENRFSFALFNAEGEPLEQFRAEVGFGPIRDGKATIRRVAEAGYRRVVTSFEHVHPDAKVHVHQDARGVYVVDRALFEEPGFWGALVTATPPEGGKSLSGSLGFEVKERSSTPAVGEPAPASRNPTVADVADLVEIDTSIPPRPELHQLSVAQALERQRAFVVVFATPTFCTSRLCGPVTDEVASLFPKYHDRVEFIHIEPYELGPLREEGLFRLSIYTKEWKLPTEPWVFVVDAQGRLAAKFEGLATREEIEVALQRMLGG